MREPAFWYRPVSLMARLLAPFGAVYGVITARRMTQKGAAAELPVICIGNYHVGGAGKTPTTLKLADILRETGEAPCVVSRGYGGIIAGPVRVDPNVHSARDVGDEPLMMASRVPVIVARDRVAGAAFAKEQNASVILLDDGFQNPSLAKNVSLIVIDSMRGLGNGFVFPAGPLRAPLLPQVEQTDVLVVVGKARAADAVISMVTEKGRPVLHAMLVATQQSVAALRGRRVLAFAGIGDPSRFFAMLRANDVDVVVERTFADHHAFSLADIDGLLANAQASSLALVTTEKDIARIRSDRRFAQYEKDIEVFAVTLDFDDENSVRDFLTVQISKARNRRS